MAKSGDMFPAWKSTAKLYRSVGAIELSATMQFVAVVLSVLLGTGGRLALISMLGAQSPFFTLVPAIIFSVWAGGLLGGIAATVLSCIAFGAFLAPAIHFPLNQEGGSIFTFVVISLILSAVGQNLINSRRQIKEMSIVTERALEQARLVARRETILNQLSDVVRHTASPDAARLDAVRLLGDALGLDRCYIAEADLENDTINVLQDWHTENLSSLAGECDFTDIREIYKDLYRGNNLSAITDIGAAEVGDNTRAYFERHGIRARLSTSLVEDSGLVITLTCAMSTPRVWSENDISLIESVSLQVRTVVASARVLQRERRLAEQFQQALQPPIPSSVPGFNLASFYRPAMLDQGVGGDFMDVYTGADGVTYIAIGDLSGKGLVAASSVEMVRHMLRFSLYNESSLSSAISALNATIYSNNLLSGFVTLFVGRYDAKRRELTYVNCGQDAGLVVRAETRDLSRLPDTGPIVGVIEDANYEEQSVSLMSGDVLALFTDGFTEAGPSRKDLLKERGFSAILLENSCEGTAAEIVSAVVAGVDRFAGDGVRDDQCLLIGIAA